jgi:hypothetical protein
MDGFRTQGPLAVVHGYGDCGVRRHSFFSYTFTFKPGTKASG